MSKRQAPYNELINPKKTRNLNQQGLLNCVEIVIPFLSPLPDLYNLACVSKYFETAVLRCPTILNMDFNNLSKLKPIHHRFLSLLLRQKPQKLVFQSCKISNRDFARIFSLFQDNYEKLEVLDIQSCSNLSDSVLSKFMLNCRNLKVFRFVEFSEELHWRMLCKKCFGNPNVAFSRLKILDTPTLSHELIHNPLAALLQSQLEVLNIPSFKIYSADLMNNLGPSLKTMRELSISVEHSGTATFEFPHFENLTKLVLYKSAFKRTTLILELPHLLHLSIHSSDIPVILGVFPLVEHLDISWSSLTSESIDEIIRQNCSHLKEAFFEGSYLTQESYRLLNSKVKVNIDSCRSIPLSIRKQSRSARR